MPAPVRHDELIDTVIDRRYRVIERLDEGGMGYIYRAAQQTLIAREVAIKVLHASSAFNQVIVRRFENEARIIGKLRHPNTLRMIDAGYLGDGRLYIVTELLQGEPLSRVIERGPLTERATIAIMRQICGSLAEAHELGIIHRDLKPPNVFLERIGTQEIVKVLDFGVAKLADAPGLTAPMQIVGTPGYMAPELLRLDLVDARADLYSLGVVAYECLTGSSPFPTASAVDAMLKTLSAVPPAIRTLTPAIEIDPELDDLIQQLLQKEASKRPPSAADVSARLEAIERRTPVLGPLRHRPDAQDLEPSSSEEETVPPNAGLMALSRTPDPRLQAPDPTDVNDDETEWDLHPDYDAHEQTARTEQMPAETSADEARTNEAAPAIILATPSEPMTPLLAVPAIPVSRSPLGAPSTSKTLPRSPIAARAGDPQQRSIWAWIVAFVFAVAALMWALGR